jgi:hypothetical protein
MVNLLDHSFSGDISTLSSRLYAHNVTVLYKYILLSYLTSSHYHLSILTFSLKSKLN